MSPGRVREAAPRPPSLSFSSRRGGDLLRSRLTPRPEIPALSSIIARAHKSNEESERGREREEERQSDGANETARRDRAVRWACQRERGTARYRSVRAATPQRGAKAAPVLVEICHTRGPPGVSLLLSPGGKVAGRCGVQREGGLRERNDITFSRQPGVQRDTFPIAGERKIKPWSPPGAH